MTRRTAITYTLGVLTIPALDLAWQHRTVLAWSWGIGFALTAAWAYLSWLNAEDDDIETRERMGRALHPSNYPESED